MKVEDLHLPIFDFLPYIQPHLKFTLFDEVNHSLCFLCCMGAALQLLLLSEALSTFAYTPRCMNNNLMTLL